MVLYKIYHRKQVACMDKILQFLKENPVFYFATVDDGKPRVRPFGFFMGYKGRLYFGMGRHKASYRQLHDNPNVEVSATSEDNVWIRIRGKAVFDDDEEAIKQAFVTMPLLRNIYNEKTGFKLGLVYLTEGEAEFNDFAGNFERISF